MMPETSEKQLSGEQSRLVAAIIREQLARRRISRQHLADQAKISISTLEKALSGRRPFTLATTVRLERSEEHTSELQSLRHLVCRLLLEKKKNKWKLTQINDDSRQMCDM